MGNHPSQEEVTFPPPTQPPETNEFLDFNQYGWLYMGAGLLILLILACCIKYCCCSKPKNDLEKNAPNAQMTENEMLLLQREQYLGPGRMSSISQYSTGPIVRGNRQAASVTREMSLQPTLRPSQQKSMMVYNPEYAGVQIQGAAYAGNTYRVSNSTYRMPLRDSRRNSWRSQRSLPRRALHQSEDSLLGPDTMSSYNERELPSLSSRDLTVNSTKSIEEMVAEKLDEEVERRVQIELSKIIQNQQHSQEVAIERAVSKAMMKINEDHRANGKQIRFQSVDEVFDEPDLTIASNKIRL